MASETGPQSPASGAGAGNTEPPSVEAEIVDAEIVDAEFVDAPGSIKADEPPPAAPPPRKRGALSPGLLFFAGFVILAAGVFAAFAFSRPDAKKALPEAQQAEETSPTPAAEANEQPAANSARPATDASKIVNSGLDSAKAAAALDSSALPPSSRGLPEPPPPGSANDELQQAAKEALRQFGPDSGDAIDQGPPQSPEPQIEFQTEGAVQTAPGESTASVAPPAEQESVTAQFAASSADIAALKDNFDRELAQRDARANAEIASLRAEVERLQQGNPHTNDIRDPAAFVALASLQRAIDRGKPFTQELDEFARLAPGAPPIEKLRATAATGAPTLATLTEEFDPAARAAIAAAAREKATGWLGGVTARIQEIVSVRPARPTAGSGAAQIMSRAEGALESGDLAGAAAEAETLRGAAAAELAPWLARARLRLGADDAVATLNSSFMTAYRN